MSDDEISEFSIAFCRLKCAVETNGAAIRFPFISFISFIPASFFTIRDSAEPIMSFIQITSISILLDSPVATTDVPIIPISIEPLANAVLTSDPESN